LTAYKITQGIYGNYGAICQRYGDLQQVLDAGIPTLVIFQNSYSNFLLAYLELDNAIASDP
jgi:hypothetical protein